MYEIERPSQTVGSCEAPSSVPETTISPPVRSAWKFVLGTLLSIVGLVLALIGTVMILGLPFYPLFAESDFGLTRPAAALGLVAVILGLKIQLFSKRLRVRTGEQALAKDLRDPVVYLRPFVTDTHSTDYPEVRLLSEIFTGHTLFNMFFGLLRAVPTLIRLVINPPLTEEEQLAAALNIFGPVIAVASPDETLPPAGIPRLSFTTSRWQEQVSALLKRARLVVIQCGESYQDSSDGYWPTAPAIEGGFRWELEETTKCVPPERIVLLLPFDDFEYERFCEKVRAVFPCEFPPYWRAASIKARSRALAWFDSQWKLFLAPITWVDNSLRLDTRYPSAASLRSKFQAVQEAGFDLQYGGRKIGKRLIATLMDLALVVGITTVLISAVVAQMKWVIGETTALKAILVLLPIAACLYSALFEASSLMATAGKSIMGLMVVDNDGGRITLLSALRRAAIKVFLLPVTWIPAVFATDRRTLHDRWSGSIVALGALRLCEPPRRRFVLLAYFVVATVYLMTIGAIGSAVKSRPALIFPQGVEKVDLAWQSDRYMVIPARVNDQPLSLLFNTNYAITAIDRDVAHAAGIKSFDTTVMHLGLKDVVAAVSIPYDLRFGSMVLTNTKVHIIDLSWLRAALGIHIDGVIGYDLLSQGVVQIDSRSKRIAILNPQTFHYNGSGESIQISVLHGMPSVAATIKIPGHEAVKDNFWLNPGVPPMGVNHPLIRASTSGPPIAPNRFVIGTIEYIQLGKFKLEHLPSMCCTGTDTVDRLVGSVALSRFNVIFDYPHSRVILEQRE